MVLSKAEIEEFTSQDGVYMLISYLDEERIGNIMLLKQLLDIFNIIDDSNANASMVKDYFSSLDQDISIIL